MKELELTPRLMAIADQVPQGAKLADVGTDHAYLPVYLLRQDRIGIVGSNGKTTTKELTSRVLAEKIAKFRVFADENGKLTHFEIVSKK